MENYFISGIQQIGVGTVDMEASWKWYIEHFQIDIRILEDDTVAELMLPYTGNSPQKRHACIAINMQGGGGLEIWQYSERKPQPVGFEVQVGDLGIFCAKIKSRDVAKLYAEIKTKYSNISELTVDPEGKPTFFVQDPWGNYFQIVQYKSIYVEEHRYAGGALGCMIGVTDIDKALIVYRDILGYDQIVYDKSGQFEDLKFMKGGNGNYRRVLLTHSKPRKGAFSEMLGHSRIELIVAKERNPKKIYEGRFWGDPGFIQICFDVTYMDSLRNFCESKGFPFTVDSSINKNNTDTFDMGDAAGRFAYIEDPDGTLIEFVETHKLPVIKKMGLNIDLRKRKREKALPRFLLGFLRMNRYKIQ